MSLFTLPLYLAVMTVDASAGSVWLFDSHILINFYASNFDLMCLNVKM
jgi:hypothetical protein